MDDGWCEGELNGQRGMFPDNFVQLRPAAIAPVHQPQPAAIAPVHQPPPASDPPGGSVPLRSKLVMVIGCSGTIAVMLLTWI